MMATDDRYTDDVHYIGGCVTVSELSQYAVSMVGMNAMPPKAEYRGAAWADEWRERLEQTPVWLFEWLRQQHDGPYWRQGSLAPDYDAIEAAIFSIGGWMDAYVDPVLRMHERCTAPRRSLIGNWVHSLPGRRLPGPEPRLAPRDGPVLRPLAQGHRQRGHGRARASSSSGASTPTRSRSRRSGPGEWLALETWPPPASREVSSTWRRVRCRSSASCCEDARHGRRRRALPPPADDRHAGVAVVGRRRRPERPVPRPAARRIADPDVHLARRSTRRSTSSGSRPRSSPGSRPRPIATAVVRLMDVAPDGTSAQVTAGILNLTHRDSHASPAPLEPGAVHQRPCPDAGDRLPVPAGASDPPVSVASSYWPVIWPSPFRAEYGLHLGGDRAGRGSSCRSCPRTRRRSRSRHSRPRPRGSRIRARTATSRRTWQVTDDVIDGSVTVTTSESGEVVLPDGRTTLYSGERLEMTARDDDPAVRPDAQRGRLPAA